MKMLFRFIPGKDICHSGYFIRLMLVVILIAGFIPACGKKGDPVPLRFSLPQAISNLKADRVEPGIKLSWTTAIADGSFKIFRNEEFPDEKVCDGCPRNYVIISELAIGDPKLFHETSTLNYSWIDTNVENENSYFYRIVVCDASEFCSEPSNTVAVPGQNESLPKEPGTKKR